MIYQIKTANGWQDIDTEDHGHLFDALRKIRDTAKISALYKGGLKVNHNGQDILARLKRAMVYRGLYA